MKIDITPIKLENQIPTDDPYQCYIELKENRLIRYMSFWAEEPTDPDDHSLGWGKVYNHFETEVVKLHIAGIEMQWLPRSKKWGVFIMVDGLADDIKIIYKKQGEASETFAHIKKWLFG